VDQWLASFCTCWFKKGQAVFTLGLVNSKLLTLTPGCSVKLYLSAVEIWRSQEKLLPFNCGMNVCIVIDWLSLWNCRLRVNTCSASQSIDSGCGFVSLHLIPISAKLYGTKRGGSMWCWTDCGTYVKLSWPRRCACETELTNTTYWNHPQMLHQKRIREGADWSQGREQGMWIHRSSQRGWTCQCHNTYCFH